MDFSNYRELCEKVSQKFSQIRERRPADFQCKAGCHSCCVPNIQVFSIERAHIQDFLRENPAALEKIEKLGRTNPHKGSRCSLLDENGECVIYPARPLVCRSHGAPLVLRKKNDDLTLDACPLNFTKSDLGKLAVEDTIRLETMNTLLALVNRRAFPDSDGERFPLHFSQLKPEA